MKSFFRFFLIFLFCSALLLPVQAASSDLTLSDGEAAAGEVVYLTLTLNKKTMGNTMGVEYSYNTKHLEAVPELCSWTKGGAVKDFGLKDRGVWTSQSAAALEGTICVLAFRIKKDASFDKTSVSCSLVVKNGTEQTGQYKADATVKIGCNHSFADWEAEGNALHSRKCENCNLSQTEPHKWDEGVVQVNPEDSRQTIRVFTCTACGATRQELVSNKEEEDPGVTAPTQPTRPTEPTIPAPTNPEENRPQPTEPERIEPTNPTEAHQNPTQPTVPSQHNPTEHDHQDHIITTVPAQQPVQSGQHSPDDGHDHSGGVIYDSEGNILATFGSDIQEGIDQIHSADDGHDHGSDEVLISETNPRMDTTLIIAALAIAGIGVAVLFTKKKKR